MAATWTCPCTSQLVKLPLTLLQQIIVQRVILNYIVGLQFCIRKTPTWRTWHRIFLIFRHDSVNSALHSDVHQCKLAVKAILHRILSWKLDFTEFYCILRHRWTFELRLLDCILLFAAINLNIQTRQHLHLLWVRISYVQKLGCTYCQCQFFL